MPCHSTPYHASLHRSDARLRFLDCSPPPPPLTGAAAAPGRVEEDVEAASDAGAAGMAAAATAAPHGFPPQWGPPVWSGTPIRDTSCRCQPLTGVPYLRPGPRSRRRSWRLGTSGRCLVGGCSGWGQRRWQVTGVSCSRPFQARSCGNGSPVFPVSCTAHARLTAAASPVAWRSAVLRSPLTRRRVAGWVRGRLAADANRGWEDEDGRFYRGRAVPTAEDTAAVCPPGIPRVFCVRWCADLECRGARSCWRAGATIRSVVS